MQLSPVVTLVLSIVFGAAAILGARLWLGNGNEDKAVSAPVAVNEPEPVKIETQPVLVAVREIPRGITLDTDWFEVEERPVNAVPRGAFDSRKALEEAGTDRRTLVALESGDIISEKMLLSPDMRASLSTRIHPGYRAFSIRTNDVSGVAGFVLPGDRVDVIFIQNEVDRLIDDQTVPSAALSRPMAKVLLQNVEVLGVDLNDDLTGNNPSSFKTATLAVSLEQAQKLSVASQLGNLSLALRGSADDAYLEAEAVSIGKERQAPRQIAYQPTPLKAQKSASSTVEVVLGNQEATHTVPSSQ